MRNVPSAPEVNRAISVPPGSRTATVAETTVPAHAAPGETMGHCGPASVTPSIPEGIKDGPKVEAGEGGPGDGDGPVDGSRAAGEGDGPFDG